MAICLHLELKRQADTMFRPFKSFEEGYRWYRCKKCGVIFKAKETTAHVEEASHVPREAAAPNELKQVTDHKFVAQECHDKGCQFLVLAPKGENK